ncbi:hypothetical protein AOQ84DRAFT_390428 [Glonium stellatum]|uniref:GST N-terminal domain-containing protein n=1 Tax=Glonium stellatum TaxID=574774 RepID=A0A8E2EXD1_9PEZI|nr:hypothetical protein AOQ84DRAFT_390428 [Glonium stellatum]
MATHVLYDLPSKDRNACWSLNPWKTRLLLNYKGIDYKTEWLEYPDVAPTLKSFGLPPNDPNASGYFADYTIPTMRIDSNTYVMDSAKIAVELEKRYPSPSVYLDSPIVSQAQQVVTNIQKALTPNLIPKAPGNLLNERSKEYFERTREVRFGMPLSQMEKDKGGETPWAAAKQPIQELADLLKEQGGPFFLGKTVSYADFILVAFLHFLKRVDQAVFDRFVAHDPAFSAIYEASQAWLARDDH